MSSQLRYTIDVTVQSDHDTPAPTYRYTGNFDSPAGVEDVRGLRRYALALAGLKSRVTNDAAEQSVIGTETDEAALRRMAKELIETHATLGRETDRADEMEKLARNAERRAIRAAHALDVRDGHARDLVTALTSSGFPLPWWITATRALDSLDALANSGAQLEPGTETLDETLDRVGDDVTRALADNA